MSQAVLHGEHGYDTAEKIWRSGGEVPEGLLPPDLLPGLDEWYIAFWRLHPFRSNGWGLGRIPLTEIVRMSDIMELGEERNAFIQCIMAMDGEWLRLKEEGVDSSGQTRETLKPGDIPR